MKYTITGGTDHYEINWQQRTYCIEYKNFATDTANTFRVLLSGYSMLPTLNNATLDRRQWRQWNLIPVHKVHFNITIPN